VKFLKFVKIHFIASPRSVKFSNSHNSSSRLHWGNHWIWTVGSWGLWFWYWGRQWSCRWFTDFVRLLMIMLNCWRVNNLELSTSQIF